MCPAPAPWRLLIVDDHPIVRTGLAALIDAEADMRVCAQAEDYQGAMAAIQRDPPDLVIVDLSLRESSGLELLKEVVRRRIPAIVVSMQDAPTWAERALAAGARGYVHKSDAGRNVVQAIRRVQAGRIFVSESMSELLLERRHAPSPPEHGTQASITELTDREIDVLMRIGSGLTTHQISSELHISAKTVQTYRERIKRKLDLDSSAELSHAATRWVLERPAKATPSD